jgi:predicted DNA-binding ribbon-helix-helix protein
MNSNIVKHSVRVQGRKTSITLEPEFWDVIRATAATRRMTVAALISQVDRERTSGSLSSALRLFALELYKHNPVGGDRPEAIAAGGP